MEFSKTGNSYRSEEKCDYNIYFFVNGQRIDTTLINIKKLNIIHNNELGSGSIDIEYNPENPKEVDIPFKETRKILNIVLPILVIFFIFMFYLFYKYRNSNIVKGIAVISWISDLFSSKK